MGIKIDCKVLFSFSSSFVLIFKGGARKAQYEIAIFFFAMTPDRCLSRRFGFFLFLFPREVSGR